MSFFRQFVPLRATDPALFHPYVVKEHIGPYVVLVESRPLYTQANNIRRLEESGVRYVRNLTTSNSNKKQVYLTHVLDSSKTSKWLLFTLNLQSNV